MSTPTYEGWRRLQAARERFRDEDVAAAQEDADETDEEN